MAAFLLIFFYVRYELSFDRWHENASRIYRVVQQQPGNVYMGSDSFAVTAAPLASALMEEFPEVEAATRIDTYGSVLVSHADKSFLVDSLFWADFNFFEIFSVTMLKGDPETALDDPLSILFSESAARRHFGDADPMGQTLTLAETSDVVVTGVFADLPRNSHFKIDAVVPFEALAVLMNQRLDSWGNNFCFTYLLLRDGADPVQLEAKFPTFFEKYSKGQGWDHEEGRARLYLQALTRIHLYSRINMELSPNSDIKSILLFSTIAFLILVIACINYMNLATARSAKRSREVGMRKVVGARRGQLVKQFLGESTLLTFAALVLALGLVALALPAFNRFLQRDMSFNPIQNPWLPLSVGLIFILVGLLAGFYPAVFLSRAAPIASLRAFSTKGRGGSLLRNGLVVFQFTVSVLLILSTVVVRNQLHYIQNRDMGYSREHIVILYVRDPELRRNIQACKNELMTSPDVLKVATSTSLPNRISSSTFAKWPGKPDDVEIPIYVCDADYDFCDIFELAVVQGRKFSREHPSDSQGAFLINETALRAIGWDDPLGREFNRWGNDEPGGRVVGILKDFHMHSLHLEIQPLYVYLNPAQFRYLSIKIRGVNIPRTLSFIEDIVGRFSPKYPFSYSFFDDVFDRAYREEQRLGQMFSAFALLAVFIACLGLFGLSSFTSECRTKEIGIRKVMGATASQIVHLLSAEYVKRVVLAILIAWPLGFYAMTKWLNHFAYRIRLSVGPFAAAGMIALAIALLTVSLQTLRAAAVNPSDSLRYE
jgi:putative ABC transport system permease protein